MCRNMQEHYKLKLCLNISENVNQWSKFQIFFFQSTSSPNLDKTNLIIKGINFVTIWSEYEMDIKKFQTVHYYLKRSAHSSYIYMKMKRRRMEINTKLDKEFEEAANVERNVRDKLAIFPISLNSYSYIHCVCYSSSSRHSQFLLSDFFCFWGQGGSLFSGWAKLIFLLALL